MAEHFEGNSIGNLSDALSGGMVAIGTDTTLRSVTLIGQTAISLSGDATVFDDLPFQLSGQRLESPSSGINYESAESAVSFASSTNEATEYVTMNVQMPHRWKVGSVVYPHLHWFKTTANPVNWMIYHRWQINGAAKTTAWTPLVAASAVYTYTSGTLNQITIFGAAGITPPEGAGLSDILQIRLTRDYNNSSALHAGAENSGTNNVDMFAMSFDLHFEIDSLGSQDEYSKTHVSSTSGTPVGLLLLITTP